MPGSTETSVPTETPPTSTPTTTEIIQKEIILPTDGEQVVAQVEGFEYGLKFKDPHAVWEMSLEILMANKKQNGVFFQRLLGTTSPSRQSFEDFLANSVGPNGESYWFPFEAGGVKYKMFSAAPNNDFLARFKEVNGLDGISLKKINSLIFDPTMYAKNKSQIDQIIRESAEYYVNPFQDGEDKYITFGFVIYKEELLFIDGAKSYEGMLPKLKLQTLGYPDKNSTPKEKIVSAEWLTIRLVAENWVPGNNPKIDVCIWNVCEGGVHPASITDDQLIVITR